MKHNVIELLVKIQDNILEAMIINSDCPITVSTLGKALSTVNFLIYESTKEEEENDNSTST